MLTHAALLSQAVCEERLLAGADRSDFFFLVYDIVSAVSMLWCHRLCYTDSKVYVRLSFS